MSYLGMVYHIKFKENTLKYVVVACQNVKKFKVDFNIYEALHVSLFIWQF